jgi:hypothetical protein
MEKNEAAILRNSSYERETLCLFISVMCYTDVTYAGCGQNDGKTKKLRNRIYVERTSVDNTECSSSVCSHSVELVSVHS